MAEQIKSINDYGFLSMFDIEPIIARERVRMLFNAGIIHFQFYDCMERYETPFDLTKKEWKDPLGRQIRRDTLEAYIDEIQKLGGKSWFYIPVYGVSPNYTVVGLENALFSFVPETQEFVQEWFCVDCVNNDPQKAFVSVVDPSSQRWKEHFTEQLRLAVSELGFNGIHFDQYGSLGDRFKFRYKESSHKPMNWSWENVKDKDCFEEIDKIKLIVDFLEYFKEQMPNVPFTFNAVDGYGLEETRRLVEFPYLELWNDESISFYSSKLSSEMSSSRDNSSRNDSSKLCCSKSKDSRKFVIAAYTHCKIGIGGLFDDAVFIRRKLIINHNGGRFLYKGDDNRFLTSCYFPDAKKIENTAFE